MLVTSRDRGGGCGCTVIHEHGKQWSGENRAAYSVCSEHGLRAKTWRARERCGVIHVSARLDS
jgi:hypothetical protein